MDSQLLQLGIHSEFNKDMKNVNYLCFLKATGVHSLSDAKSEKSDNGTHFYHALPVEKTGDPVFVKYL